MTQVVSVEAMTAPDTSRVPTLAASIGKDGLSVTDLKGRLFGGAFAASGTLAPRGNEHGTGFLRPWAAALSASDSYVSGLRPSVFQTLNRNNATSPSWTT